MILLLQKFNLEKTYQYLLIALGFFMPLSVSLANLIIVIIVLLWLFSGDYRKKYNEIINSKLMIASIFFYLLHIIGMLLTEDYRWGLHILHKMWYFILLLPILFTLVRKEYTKYYIYSFLTAIAITEILSYLVWFEIIGEFRKAYYDNPTPFMSHISFNPFLAVAIYLVFYEILFNTGISKIKFWSYSLFSAIMVFNMFITGGRAGQVMFFSIIMILSFQYFRHQKIKALISTMILIPGIFFTAYQVSPLFKERAILAVDEIVNYDKNSVSINQMVSSSVGARILFSINSWEIIKKNLLFGVGTGDFPKEYQRVNNKNSPNGPYVNNPHNMYALISVQLGLVGLLSMLSIMYYQIKISYKQSNPFFRDFGLTLPLLFLVIMWSDSYLLGHFTGLLFVFFSSFIYKDFEQY